MNQKDIPLEYPNIPLKNIPKNNDNLFSQKSCAVAVHYWIYDKHRKTILNYGSSRACGCNHTKSSIHAEQLAINYCRKHHKNNRLQIIIWRWDKNGKIIPMSARDDFKDNVVKCVQTKFNDSKFYEELQNILWAKI